MTNTKTTTPAASTSNTAAAADALHAIADLTRSARSDAKGEKAAAKAACKAENREQRLQRKLEELTAGKNVHSKRQSSQSMRKTLIGVVIAVNSGATEEQLAATGVAKRFPWAKAAGPVAIYAKEKASNPELVIRVLGAVEEPAEPVVEQTAEAAPAAKPAKKGGRAKKAS